MNQLQIAVIFAALAWIACVNAVVAVLFGLPVYPFVIAAALSVAVVCGSERDQRLFDETPSLDYTDQ